MCAAAKAPKKEVRVWEIVSTISRLVYREVAIHEYFGGSP